MRNTYLIQQIKYPESTREGRRGEKLELDKKYQN